MQRLTFIRAGLILNAFLICLVYTYKIKGPWWALAAFVGSGVFMYTDDFFPTPSEDNECIIGIHKMPNGFSTSGCFDIWHVIHFFFWTLIGLLVPGMYFQTFVFSVLWELYEQISGTGRVEDVFINMAGYTIGSLLSKAR